VRGEEEAGKRPEIDGEREKDGSSVKGKAEDSTQKDVDLRGRRRCFNHNSGVFFRFSVEGNTTRGGASKSDGSVAWIRFRTARGFFSGAFRGRQEGPSGD
jgi:hypothetical protein